MRETYFDKIFRQALKVAGDKAVDEMIIGVEKTDRCSNYVKTRLSVVGLILLSHGYKLFIKRRIMKDMTVAVFVEPDKNVFVVTVLENPMRYDYGMLREYKIRDKRKGFTFEKKLARLIRNKLNLPWTCHYCGSKNIMTFHEAERRKNCYKCQTSLPSGYGSGRWSLAIVDYIDDNKK